MALRGTSRPSRSCGIQRHHGEQLAAFQAGTEDKERGSLDRHRRAARKGGDSKRVGRQSGLRGRRTATIRLTAWYGHTVKGMAVMTIKSTYSLDVGTVRTLEGLARRWNVSKSEALRRAIRSEAERQPSPADASLQALRALQKSVAARGVDLEGWEHQANEIRSASFRRLSNESR